MELLNFQRSIVDEVLNEDGMWILAPGLGLHQIVGVLLYLQDVRRKNPEEKGTVLVLGATPLQRNIIRRELARLHDSMEDRKIQDCAGKGSLIDVTAEIPTAERLRLYHSCPSVFVTTRILVVDLLSGRLPTSDVASVVILNAHRVIESSGESFAVRLIHEKRQETMIRAFSDVPNAFSSEFGKVEKVLKSLDIRKVHLWPRFQAAVQEELEAAPPELVEISVPSDDFAALIYEALAELIESCMKEIKRLEKLDASELTVSRGLFTSFDESIKRQLAPIWHIIPPKTRQIVSDLRTLRTLAQYLFKFDAVTFLMYLDSLRTTEGAKCAWIFHSAAHAIFEAAKSRVFRLVSQDEQDRKKQKTGREIPSTSGMKEDLCSKIPVIETVLEELPKWHILLEVLEEARDERSRFQSESPQPPIVVFCRDDFTCLQLQEVLGPRGPSGFMKSKYEKYLHYRMDSRRNKSKNSRINHQNKVVGSSNISRNIVPRMMGSSLPGEDEALTKEANNVQPTLVGNVNAGASSVVLENRERSVNVQLFQLDTEESHTESKAHAISQQEIANEIEKESTSEQAADVVLVSLDTAGVLPLWLLKPMFVVIYEPDITLTRSLEVYKAQRPSNALRVYLLRYENSPEMDKYQASVVRERSSFESVIRNKAVMAPPKSKLSENSGTSRLNSFSFRGTTANNALTRQAGGRLIQTPDRVRVVVDVREFMSSLPAVLHARGLELIPVTLEVGDYVLSPEICVERKTLADLKSSLFSGRLYQQATAMCQHYATAILLIEFDGDKAFALQSSGELGDDIQMNSLISKLVLLCLHHPRLRIAWSRSLHATADLFKQLKTNHEEPDPVWAATVGLTPEDKSSGELVMNGAALEVLRRLPGVTEGNWRALSRESGSLVGILDLPFEKLAELLGGPQPAKKLTEFLKQECRALFAAI